MTENLWPYPGSRWWKFDFHTHTPASIDTSAWRAVVGSSDEVTPEKWLLKYMAAEIDCVAVTDHNSGAWIDKLKEAYEKMKGAPPAGFRELYLFPGVEISVNGGVHLLAIFDIDAKTRDIDTLKGSVGYQGTDGDSDGVTRKSAAEVVQAVLDAKAIPIPAHVDLPEKKKGLLAVRPGTQESLIDANTLRQVLDGTGISAMELIDSAALLPTIFLQKNIRWARVLGSDCHSFQGSTVPGSHYTWIKMAEPALEGLRLALLDGDGVSVRRSDEGPFDPFHLPEHFIEEIEIGDARFMGNGAAERLSLSPYYNALIGGRGTGKSTVVHALRLAYRRDSELERFEDRTGPRAVFEAFRETTAARGDVGALREHTEILVSLRRDGVRHRLRWRADGQGAVVEECTSKNWRPATGQAVTAERFPLRIFSQGQIAAMAGDNRQALLDVIDDAAGIAAMWESFEEVKRGYFALRARWRELEGKLAGREEAQRRLDDAKRKIASFDESRYAETLQAHQHGSRQRREVDALIEQAEIWPARVRRLVEDLVLDDWPDRLFDTVNDADVLTWRTDLERVLAEYRLALTRTADEFERSLGVTFRDETLAAWHARVDGARDAYEELNASLEERGVADSQEFGRLVKVHQDLETEHKHFDVFERDRAALQGQIEAQWQRLLEARRAITEARSTFLTEHLKENKYVYIKVVPFGDEPRVLEISLRTLLEGQDNISERFGNDILFLENERPKAGLVHQYLEYSDRSEGLEKIKNHLIRIDTNLGGHFRNFLEREHKARPEFADHIRCWFPEDDLRIEYSRRGDGRDFASISQGSAGQRSAALLAFLLSFGNEPLVLDQPEDDLDNHLIYDLIVRQIRENKHRRQLVIVTHNPNIVVNGDAEMVHAFDFTNGQCHVRENGALQEKAVRDEVCRVMEGGHEAFSRRWVRLGKEV